MRLLILLMLAMLPAQALAQVSFAEQIAQHREHYKKEFLTTSTSPLKSVEDLSHLRFYAPDSTYRVEATVHLTPKAEPFDMPTYSGKTKAHVSYAVLSFTLRGKPQQLTVYRSLDLARMPGYRDYLFLPFKDATSGQATYGGGRYLDLRTGDIQNGRLMLDFNKAYNPYCAFSDG